MQVYFLQNTNSKNESRSKLAQTKPRGCKITKIWPDMAPKGTQFEPKGHQNELKGCQRGVKSEAKINKNTTKNYDLEKGRKKDVKCNIFLAHFRLIFHQECVQKSMRKTMPKNTSKNMKIKQKTRHDPTPKNEDSQISSAKADPPK